MAGKAKWKPAALPVSMQTVQQSGPGGRASETSIKVEDLKAPGWQLLPYLYSTLLSGLRQRQMDPGG